MYKLVAIDADGTLLDGQTVPKENIRAINEAQQKGVYVALCSGRSMVSLKHFAKLINMLPKYTHIISFHGALVFDGSGNILRDNRMNLELSLYLINKLRKFKQAMAFYTNQNELICEYQNDSDVILKYSGGSFVNPTFVDSFEAGLKKSPYKLMLLGDSGPLKEAEDYMLENGRDMNYQMFFSSKRLLEFTHSSTTKGKGLTCVCKSLGLEASKDAIAIGDSFNDISMIETAALGCCMANGEDRVKALSGYVTEKDNKNCGVAEIFDKYIL